MYLSEMQAIVDECKYADYDFCVTEDRRGALYLQAKYDEADVDTGIVETQFTRKWLLSPMMTKSEIVQTVFKCCITSMEHRCREWFRYKGKAIFGPHFDVDALHAICELKDKRKS